MECKHGQKKNVGLGDSVCLGLNKGEGEELDDVERGDM